MQNNINILIGSVKQALDNRLILGPSVNVETVVLFNTLHKTLNYCLTQNNVAYFDKIKKLKSLILSLRYSCSKICNYKNLVEETLDYGSYIEDTVFYWQYEDIATDISAANLIDQDFLDLQTTAVLVPNFVEGITIPYTQIGRIAFAIQEVDKNVYQITDSFGNDLTSTIFDTYYNVTLKTQVYISKEIYTFGNVYFKIKMIE
jgi:hypothetical protein